MTVPTGDLIRMVSLIFSPITIRFKVLLLPVFLGRVFGKLRFLKGWLSFCGQQFIVGSLISCLGVSLW